MYVVFLRNGIHNIILFSEIFIKSFKCNSASEMFMPHYKTAIVAS